MNPDPDPSLFLYPRSLVKTRTLKKVTVIYNVVKQLSYGLVDDLLPDEDSVKMAQIVFEELKKEGFTVDLFEVNEETVDKLFELKSDLIFNLCYGIGSIPKTEAQVVKILEKTGIPFTGAKSNAIILTTDKILTKKKFIDNNIPTPVFQVFVSSEDKLDQNLHFPLIVKPKSEDCSIGIQNNSVVTNKKSLRKILKFLFETYKEPVLIEKYIEGRELNVTVLGNGDKAKVLPISEIIFGPSFSKKWKIVDFDAKWKIDSISFKDTPGKCPAELSSETEKKITELSLLAYKNCGCRDYARIDLRLTSDGTPYFLEINLNPAIGPEDGAIRSAKTAGFSYASFLKEIVRTAISRY